MGRHIGTGAALRLRMPTRGPVFLLSLGPASVNAGFAAAPACIFLSTRIP